MTCENLLLNGSPSEKNVIIANYLVIHVQPLSKMMNKILFAKIHIHTYTIFFCEAAVANTYCGLICPLLKSFISM